LAVLTDAQATRILLADNRAIGVDYRYGGARHSVYARGEVVLAAGALNSPRLMQLSGLGAASHLRSAGITVKADIPGVGSDLQNHYAGHLTFACHETFTTADGGRNPLRSLIERLRHGTRRSFPVATGFVTTEYGTGRP